MCGIAGVTGGGVGAAAGDRDRATVATLLEALAHRGPDGSGIWSDARTTLGAVRLAIVGGVAGAQPLRRTAGVLVGNGEVYDAARWRTGDGRSLAAGDRSDLAVLLDLLDGSAGERLLAPSAMVAAALAPRDGAVVLVRDRAGMKPLRRVVVDGRVWFASEAKALVAAGLVDPALDPTVFADTMTLGHPVGPVTPFVGITSVAPGSVLVAESGQVLAARPLAVAPGDESGGSSADLPAAHEAVVGADVDREPLPSLDAVADRLHASLVAAVASHLSVDGPVGLLLSDGVDSGVLSGLARQQGFAGPAFTVTDDPAAPEAVAAQQRARSLGLEHRLVVCSFAEYLDAVPRHIWATESWASLGGVPATVLYRRAAEEVRVVLAGDGADELLCGYEHLAEVPALAARMRASVAMAARAGLAPSRRALRRAAALADPALDAAERLDRFHRFELTDELVHNHLEPIDGAAMAWALEVRLPYLDRDVAAVALRVPAAALVAGPDGTHVPKAALRALAARHLADLHVPAHKTGLPAAGERHRERFAALCDEVLPDDHLSTHPLGRCFDRRHRLYALELWEELFVRRRAAPVEDFDLIEHLAATAGRPARWVRAIAAT